MLEFVTRVFEEFLGVTLPALGALMLVLAVRRMSAHAVLIHGTVTDSDCVSKPASVACPWVYQFYLQNLEEVSFPGPFEILIRGTLPDAQVCAPAAASGDRQDLQVQVFAGPKSVLLIPHNPQDASLRYVYWRAEFLELPPYDTWKFKCSSSCPTVEFLVRPQGTEGFLRSLRLNSRSRRKGYEGITSTPPYSVFGLVLAATLLIYLSASIAVRPEWLSLSDAWTQWQRFDWWALGMLTLIVWMGFVLIRRQVHPIIQGYLTTTKIGGKQRSAAPPVDAQGGSPAK